MIHNALVYSQLNKYEDLKAKILNAGLLLGIFFFYCSIRTFTDVNNHITFSTSGINQWQWHFHNLWVITSSPPHQPPSSFHSISTSFCSQSQMQRELRSFNITPVWTPPSTDIIDRYFRPLVGYLCFQAPVSQIWPKPQPQRPGETHLLNSDFLPSHWKCGRLCFDRRVFIYLFIYLYGCSSHN